MAAQDPLRALLSPLNLCIESLPDPRGDGNNTQYSLKDIVGSAFSVFFMQFPSFLSFQRSMEQARGNNNCRTLFGIEKIPTDAQMRNVLDEINPEEFFAVFKALLAAAAARNILRRFRYGSLGCLTAVDGTEYFRSTKLNCPVCGTRRIKGEIHYAHQTLSIAIVNPCLEHALPLRPEFIVNSDGGKKQDCERNAFGRWLKAEEDFLKAYPLTFLGDDLYANQPCCQRLLEMGHNFIFTCKPTSHEWLYAIVRGGEVEELHEREWTGRGYLFKTYRRRNDAGIRGTADALSVNWCEFEIRDESGRIMNRNGYATSHQISGGNVKEIARAGRSRWKIENESINTLNFQIRQGGLLRRGQI